MSKFIGQLCCEYCLGNSFGSRAVHFPVEGQPKQRAISKRMAHDTMLEMQMWTIWLERLHGWLKAEIRYERKKGGKDAPL